MLREMKKKLIVFKKNYISKGLQIRMTFAQTQKNIALVQFRRYEKIGLTTDWYTL